MFLTTESFSNQKCLLDKNRIHKVGGEGAGQRINLWAVQL